MASPLAGIWAMARGKDWLVQKLMPVVAVFCATRVLIGESIATAWPALAVLLVGVSAGAVYVSVLNDLTDREQDRAAGKPNHFAGRPAAVMLCMLVAPLVVGMAVGWVWRDQGWLLGLYGAAWLTFSCYSLPPLRLKERGFAGVAADACGAHLLPAMMAVLAAASAGPSQLAGPWVAAVAAWSFGYGLRGILSHQLADLGNDQVAGVTTFAQRQGQTATERFARWFAGPLELTGLAAMLVMLPLTLPRIALAVYLLGALIKRAILEVPYTLAKSLPRSRLILQSYYTALFPLSIVLAHTRAQFADIVALLIAVVLASPFIFQIGKDGHRVFLRTRKHRHRLYRRLKAARDRVKAGLRAAFVARPPR